MSDRKREKTVSLVKQQITKFKNYKKIIDVLQSSVFAKADTYLSSIKKSINQLGLITIHILLQLLIYSPQTKNKSENGSMQT